MRSLLRRRPAPVSVSFDEATGAVCDQVCRAEAVIERARTAAWFAR
ncbi:hypothetical protein [Planobispora longispora]|uniref:Uncharacterized protein n=1 Tax=Planobispora longispora TaxID=28887 RepID=A0A8J3RP54_9ACTN|nr:hypothetical protein [Planobispora longispora]BFE79465.1 hypothetical protein GCM10020093_020660 [Planobispora longispora]GIH78205.1 hypothetical protein Plo01_46340 [Planobispora longispora]